MDANKVGSQLVKSISFEVEAIPQDNSMEITTGKMTPLNVRVRVRKKEDCVVSKGILAIPRRGQPGNALETLRLASSEMTIMSFNMLMEADLEKEVIEKPKRKLFGICFGARGEKDNDKYLPKTTDDKDNIDSTSEPGTVKHSRANPQGTLGVPAPYTHRKKDTFFGKCKPGGCLDPPFGEDKYSYQPQDTTRIKALKAPVTMTLFDTRDIETEKPSHETDRPKKKEEILSAVKVTKEVNEEDGSILSLYKGKQEHNLDNNDSDYIITYPPALSSSGLLQGGEKSEKNVTLKTSGARQSRKSFNEFSSIYFSPPRTPRDSKDSSGKTEKPKSYSTKDINQSGKAESKSPRSASNANIGITKAGVVGITAIGITAAKSGKSKEGESEKKQDQGNPILNESNSYLGHTESASFPVEISEKENVELNKNKLSPHAYSNTESADKCNEQSNAADNVVEHIRAIGDKDFTRGHEAHNICLPGKIPSALKVNQPVIASDMAEKSQDAIKYIQQRNLTKNTNDIQTDAMLNVDDDIFQENKITATDRIDGSEPSEQHEGHQPTGHVEGKKRLRGRNKGMFESDKDKVSINSSGKNCDGGLAESEYFPWEGQRENEYSSKQKENLKSYYNDKNYLETKEEKDNRGQKEIDPQERSGTTREYPYMGDQHINKYSTEINSQTVRVSQTADDQEKVLPKVYADSEFSPIAGQTEEEYTNKSDNRQPFTHEEADRKFQDPHKSYIQKGDTKQEYSTTLEKGINGHYSRLGNDQEPYPQEGMNQGNINSNENIFPKDLEEDYYPKSGQRSLQEVMDQDITNHQGQIIERDGTQKAHSLHDQPQLEYSQDMSGQQGSKPGIFEGDIFLTSGKTTGDEKFQSNIKSPLQMEHSLYDQPELEYVQDMSGQQGSKHGIFEGDIFLTSEQTTSDKEFQKNIKSPLQKEFKEFKQDESYGRMSLNDYGVVDNRRTKQQDQYISLDVTAKPTDQTAGSIFLNLAFKTRIEENQTTIRTLDAAKHNDDDNVFVVRSLTKFGKAIVVPINSQHVMNLEIKSASHSPPDAKSRTPKSIPKFDSAKSVFKSSGSSLNEAHKALSIVYNKDLIPLQSIIKDLKEDINILAAQQMMLRDRLTCRRFKATVKKCGCGCGRHSYTKI